MNKNVVWPVMLLGALFSSRLFAETTPVEFHRTLSLEPTDHIILDVEVPAGDVTISYVHAGEISVTATARAADGKVPDDLFDRHLVVERNGEHLKVQFNSAGMPSDGAPAVAYKIDVPNWIAVNSNVGSGKQSISGVMGPVKVVSGTGNVRVSYIVNDLDVETGHGNVTVDRVGAAARIATGSGNITLKDVGPGSSAAVGKGRGRVDVDDVRGSFVGSTDAGVLQVKGAPYGDWKLTSVSGDIVVGASDDGQFEIDAATRSGHLSVENDDLEAPKDPDAHVLHQKVHGGGKLVRVRSTSGTIVIR